MEGITEDSEGEKTSAKTNFHSRNQKRKVSLKHHSSTLSYESGIQTCTSENSEYEDNNNNNNNNYCSSTVILPPVVSLEQKLSEMKQFRSRKQLCKTSIQINEHENDINNLYVSICLKNESNIEIKIEAISSNKILEMISVNDFLWDFVGFHARNKIGLASWSVDEGYLVFWW